MRDASGDWRIEPDLASIGDASAGPNALMTRPERAPAPKRAKSARASASAEAKAAIAPPQLDLFPVRPVIDVLDPRAVVGAHTGVEHLVRVRLRPNDAPHLIFHDRHGWYCESHGPTCHTVQLARDEIK
jgi:hypothetical protein